MEFRLLGGIEAVADGRQMDLGPARQRSVLAALLMDVGRAVPVDQLVQRVWADTPPKRAKDTLYSYLSRLRRLLPCAIDRLPGGYVLTADAQAIDVHRFRRLLAAARAEADDAIALAAYEEALGLWGGEPFEGADAPWFNATREALVRERLAADLDCTDLMLRLGQHAELQAELSARCAAHPLDERMAAQYMLALYRCGRQADALAHYRRVRRLLREELGIDPGGRLRELHEAILAGDAALTAPGEQAASPSAEAATWSVQCQLPLAVRGFVGRAALVRRLEELLTTPAARPVVLSGSPGVGKTALAVHLGHRLRPVFPDGQWYVRLLGTGERPRHPSEVLAALLRASGQEPAAIPESAEDRAAAFRSRTADRRVLLVLDDAADAEQIRPLLPGTAGVAVLITSRFDLRGLIASHAARPVPLDVLDPGEAHHLLTGALGEQRVRAEPAAAERLADLCARLPLALRIASANLAARPGRSLAAYAAELAEDGRLAKLSIAGDRQAAVRSAFDHSYATLAPEAARLFGLLGLHPGADFGAEAAAALLGPVSPYDTEELLDQLATAGLVQRTAADRFQFHDLLRLYAAEHAAADPDRAAARQRLCDWYLATADAATAFDYAAMLQLPRQRAASDRFADRHGATAWLDEERANLVALITRAAKEGPGATAWLLADQLRMYFYYRQHHTDWRTAATAGLRAAIEAGDVLAEAAMRLSLGSLAQDAGDFAAALDHFHLARRRYHDGGFAPGEAAVLANLGVQHGLRGDVAECVDHLHRSIQIYRGLEMPAQLCPVLDLAGQSHTYLGDLEQAVAFSTEAIATSAEHEHAVAGIGPLTGRAVALHGLGRYEDALADATEAVRLCREHRKQHNEAATHEILARVHRDRGHLGLARTHAVRALEMSRAFGYTAKEIDSLLTSGSLDLMAADPGQAGRHLEEALLLSRGRKYRHQEADAHIGLARVHLAQGDAAIAADHAELALTAAEELRLRPAECRARLVLAALAHADDDPAAAAHHLAHAAHLRTRTGYRPPPWETQTLAPSAAYD
ncbi:transcriptional regulator, SARP family protein [Streptomyces sp. YC504]|uniref:Transcriptional regulator, SARP family protein n=1 Tax=Streptomyces mesophilus TaxID=1775132 RepID=A0A6G4XAI6_9ACTN|nr:BTAD domain-containing putative transcriptional regulator [Streptomyces mesophilus]NGO74263.1 transcriptional regulator, SARP family protein [Streptomyces mesophilus]